MPKYRESRHPSVPARIRGHGANPAPARIAIAPKLRSRVRCARFVWLWLSRLARPAWKQADRKVTGFHAQEILALSALARPAPSAAATPALSAAAVLVLSAAAVLVLSAAAVHVLSAAAVHVLSAAAERVLSAAAMRVLSAAAVLVLSSARQGTLLRARESVRAVCEGLRAVAEHDADLRPLQHLVDVAFAELRVQDELAFAE